MSSRRTHRILARGVLLGFLLMLGSAFAAPWLAPAGPQLWVCGPGGLRPASAPDEGAPAVQSQGLACPLCASPWALPPSPSPQAWAGVAAPAPPAAAAPERAAVARALPVARGPPGP